jgi:uncharacterized protein YraI
MQFQPAWVVIWPPRLIFKVKRVAKKLLFLYDIHIHSPKIGDVMKVKTTIVLFSIVVLLALSSCSLMPSSPPAGNTSGPTQDVQQQIDQAVAATMAVQTQVALSVQQTIAAGNQDAVPPADTPQPPSAPQATNTPSTPMVSVSIDTNCRQGPGTVYPILGALLVGQTAEVVGRSHNSDNWIIKNPNGYGTCWLWAQYATVVGDTSGVPVVQPPPTPTPSDITLSIFNNTSFTIVYVYIALSSNPSWGNDQLGASDTIPIGGTYSWVFPPGVYDVKVENGVHTELESWYNLDLTTDTTLTAGP